MRTKDFLIFTFLTLAPLLSFAQSAEPVDISGSWTMSSTTPRGERSIDLVITQNGSTAIAKTKKEEFTITIDGDQLSFSRERSTPRGKMTLDFKGTATPGTMEGISKATSGPMAGREMEWSAVKKEE
ncbi:MAG: hypothetical protein MJA30_08635 [Cytophagales bacterium]|nr:hypothetical protein [Cytophagales bacterium]